MQPPSMMGSSWAFAPHQHSHPYAHARPAHNQFPRPNFCGADAFNFKDMSMSKPPSGDYFTAKPVRGSSPTASLAADLSQNFHIDRSPQFATPRRSLFTSSLFGTIDGRDTMTTPPLPSSSPGPCHDSMDISPLPHKAPFTVTTEVEVQPTPADSQHFEPPPMSSPSELPELPFESRKPLSFIERKRSTLARPSLSYSKGYSTSSVPQRVVNRESQLPPFTFGDGSKLTTSTSMSLGECFVESPRQERKPLPSVPAFGLMGPPRSKPLFAAPNANGRNGSPISGHIRKPTAPVARPRKQFRRSLSMFEHPADVMTGEQKKEYSPKPTLESISDVEEPQKLRLPHFVPDGQPDSLPRVSKETLVEVMEGKYNDTYDDSVIIDCRFEYEFEGGHIQGATNFNNKELLAKHLFECRSSKRTLLVFHCEYSAHRAPIMAKFIRGQDRAANDTRYPHLTYPEVYILDGGYSSFYSRHASRCFPQNYVEMGAKEHANTCEREMGKLRQRAKLSRAQTFAFGQHDQQQEMDFSPTGPGRLPPRNDREAFVNGSSPLGAPMKLAPRNDREAFMNGSSPLGGDHTFGRTHARRMLSY
ncbi:MAG: hypothetical protein M4579_004874 [Chaenotheca gracillima]|nr:MAG: hypothetical protein M4579_004874 [Chaenotheca gracillima]